MSKITIIPADGQIGIDGVFATVDMTDIDTDIHAVQFDDGTGAGHIEYVDNVKPNKPIGATAFRVFNKFVRRWKAATTPPLRTIEDAKTDKRREINSARDNIEQGGFPYLGKVFDSNAVSVQRMMVAVGAARAAEAAGEPYSVEWTCQDNSTLIMSAADVINLPLVFAIWGDALHQQARSLKDQVDAAETIEAVDAIAWPAEEEGGEPQA